MIEDNETRKQMAALKSLVQSQLDPWDDIVVSVDAFNEDDRPNMSPCPVWIPEGDILILAKLSRSFCRGREPEAYEFSGRLIAFIRVSPEFLQGNKAEVMAHVQNEIARLRSEMKEKLREAITEQTERRAKENAAK